MVESDRRRAATVLFGRSVALVCAALVVLVGCSAGDGSTSSSIPGSRVSQAGSVLSGSVVVGGPGETGLPPVPSTGVTVEEQRGRVLVASVRGFLPFSDDVVGCVIARVAGDGEVLGVAGDEVRQDSVAFRRMVSYGEECTQVLVFAPGFADSMQAAAGGSLTAVQMACLRDGYARLSLADVQSLGSIVLQSPGSRPAGSTAMIDRIVAACGVPPAE